MCHFTRRKPGKKCSERIHRPYTVLSMQEYASTRQEKNSERTFRPETILSLQKGTSNASGGTSPFSAPEQGETA